MKISIEVNESEIIKNVLAGIEQKEIEKILSARMKEKIIQELEHSIRKGVSEKYQSTITSLEESIDSLVIKKVKELSRIAVKDFLDNSDTDSVAEALGEYIENWLVDNEISFQFINKTGKKPHKVDKA